MLGNVVCDIFVYACVELFIIDVLVRLKVVLAWLMRVAWSGDRLLV